MFEIKIRIMCFLSSGIILFVFEDRKTKITILLDICGNMSIGQRPLSMNFKTTVWILCTTTLRNRSLINSHSGHVLL